MDEITEIHCYRKSSKPHRGGYGEKWIEDRVVNTLNTFEFHSDIRTPEIVVYVIEGHGSRPSHRGNGFSGGGV